MLTGTIEEKREEVVVESSSPHLEALHEPENLGEIQASFIGRHFPRLLRITS